MARMRQLKLRMLDESIKTVMVDENQPVANLMVIICTKLGITNSDEYSLIATHGKRKEKNDHRVIDQKMEQVDQDHNRDTQTGNHNNNNNGTRTRSSSMGAAQSPETPYLDSWLYKRTNYIKLYQKRWFVLKEGSLSYYRNPNETGLTCRGFISLTGAYIEAEEGNNFLISNGHQAYHLRTRNEIERQRWIMMLELAKSKP